MRNKLGSTKTVTTRQKALDGYFNSIVAQLFFDTELVLRKCTPLGMKRFKLTELSLDKPLKELELKFAVPDMCEKIKIVIDTGTIYKKDMRFGKQWHQVTIMPLWYGSILEGFVVTLIDVTVRRRVADKLSRLIEKQKALFSKAAHDLKTPC